MQKSDDLAVVVATIFEELDLLHLETLRCGIGILNRETRCANIWTTTQSGKGNTVQVYGNEPMDIHPLLREAFDAWVEQREDHSYVLEGEDLVNFYKAISNTNFKLPDSELITAAPRSLRQYYYVAVFQSGNLYAFRETPFPDEAKMLMRRFADVFDLTYTRFLDLQKAEAQAREAKIEAALERVRTRTMTMQKSDELAETASVVSRELIGLGVQPNRIYIGIIKDESGIVEFWITDEDGSKVSRQFTVNVNRNYSMKKMFDGWKAGKKSIIIDMEGKELADYFHFLNEELHIPFKLGLSQKRRVQSIAYFSQGLIAIASPEPLPEQTIGLFERFSGVFNLTYTRFNDLQQAEAQAREARIEAALERVRSRTMTMQRSDELQDAAILLFKQVQELGIPIWSCGYNIFEKDEEACIGWMSTQGLTQPPFKIPLKESQTFIRFVESRKNNEQFYVEEIGGAALEAHYRYMLTLPDFAKNVEGSIKAGYPLPSFQINHVVNFSLGNLIFISGKQIPEAWDVFKRFANVFEQTFIRFLDLQQAEAQAREATIEAALEKVRGKAMAMQNSNDLSSTASMVFTELRKLGINPISLWCWTIGEGIPQGTIVFRHFISNRRQSCIDGMGDIIGPSCA